MADNAKLTDRQKEHNTLRHERITVAKKMNTRKRGARI